MCMDRPEQRKQHLHILPDIYRTSLILQRTYHSCIISRTDYTVWKDLACKPFFCCFVLFVFLKTEKPKGAIDVIKFLFPHDIDCSRTTHDNNNSDNIQVPHILRSSEQVILFIYFSFSLISH